MLVKAAFLCLAEATRGCETAKATFGEQIGYRDFSMALKGSHLELDTLLFDVVTELASEGGEAHMQPPLLKAAMGEAFGAMGEEACVVSFERRTNHRIDVRPSKPEQKGDKNVDTMDRESGDDKRGSYSRLLHAPSGPGDGGSKYAHKQGVLITTDGEEEDEGEGEQEVS
jgi:hypothetical protein